MTTRFIDQDIRSDEGFRSDAYPDPLTGGDPWTIGFGCTGAGIVKGVRWSLAQAAAEQCKRRQAIEVELDRAISWWRAMCDERQDVLVNMAYNMGTAGLLAFHHTLAEAEAGDYASAAAGMLASKWATQVPKRAKRLAQQMLTGQREVQLSNFGFTASQQAIS